MQKIGLRLQRIRKQNGVSQKELAKKLHVQRQTISSYERGVSTPDIYILIAMEKKRRFTRSVLFFV